MKDLDRQDNDDFSKWWAAYPATTGHAHFPGTNVLKLNRPECKRLFRKITETGIEAEDLIRVLKEEVKERKLSSIQRNELAFMPNSINYLEKGYYLARLEKTEEDGGDDSDSRGSKLLY